MRFLLDTNVLSEPLTERPSARVLGKLAQFQGVIATGAPVLHEMLVGVRQLAPGRRKTALSEYVEAAVRSLPILPYGADAADWHASERVRLGSGGVVPSFFDGQIAAIAATNNLVLITRNMKHFKDFQGLEVASWHR